MTNLDAIRAAALAWHDAGYCVLPTAADGSKRPGVGSWTQYQHEQYPRTSLAGVNVPGIGLVCGAVSGGLEMLELEGRAVAEGALAQLDDLVTAAGLTGLWLRLTADPGAYIERTPSGGLHILYRITDAPVPGNTALARRPATEAELATAPRERIKVLAETRGEGGYVVVAPSHGPTHPTGLPWEVTIGRAGQVPTVTAAEREQLHRVFRCLDRMPEPERQVDAPRVPRPRVDGSTSPGDAFAAQVDWPEVLEPHGWTEVHRPGGGQVRYWRRPDKAVGISATTNARGTDRFHNFSTSAHPFDAEQSYSKFGAYALLNHGGDHSAAARDLARQGYGTPTSNHAADQRAAIAELTGGRDRSATMATTDGGPEEKASRRRLVLTPASDIEPEPVVWAWEDDPDGLTPNSGRIPLGSLSVSAGREGTGKSSFGIWLAAKITRGELPGALYGRPMAVIYAAVEDSWKHTLVPRLMAAGADLNKVFRVEVVEDEADGVTLSLPTDNSLLEREIKRVGAALLVLDPLMSTIGAGIDTHRERDVRVALDPLARLADRSRCVVLGIAHFNKGSGTDPSSLITGSGAFKNVPRSVFGFAKDGDGDRVMTQTKNSLGRLDLPSLSYQIEGTDVPTRHGPAHVGRLVWLGHSDRSVTDILNERGDAEDQEERKDAAEWLKGYLTDNGGEAAAVDVFKAGEKVGFSKDALKRAKKPAGVKSEKTGMDAGWMWRFKDAPEEREGSEGSKGADALGTAPFALPSDPGTTKGAEKGADSQEPHSSLPSLPSDAEEVWS
ncbi:hypothetical protein M2302_001057 [Micromonospora sp. A200]|uniref:AAA family ATPase n=1 Tax=Micromonospora sp. A200 TaxID=2940568 RepID=UPI00247316BE|nr:AAA family ATPase [Micromonospora sp. A200]MDH6460891.1 hypothetical protein [Micromonospora sp. A200]